MVLAFELYPCSGFSDWPHKKALEKVSEKQMFIFIAPVQEKALVIQLVNTFESVNRVPNSYKIVPRRSGNVATCYANADKAYKGVNWKTTKSVEDMWQNTSNWQSEKSNGYQ